MKLLSTRTYIALGLVSLVSSALLAASFLGLVPDRARARSARAAGAGGIGGRGQHGASSSSADPQPLEDVLRFVQKRNEHAALGRPARPRGQAGAGRRRPRAQLGADGRPRARATRRCRCSCIAGTSPGASWNCASTPLVPPGLAGLLHTPLILLLAFCGSSAFSVSRSTCGACCGTSTRPRRFPARVRSALDSLTEGLLVIDQKQSIVLANEAFVQAAGPLQRAADGHPGRRDRLARRRRPAPACGRIIPGAPRWSRAWCSATGTCGCATPQGAHAQLRRQLLAGAGQRAARPGGVLISLEDVTLLRGKQGRTAPGARTRPRPPTAPRASSWPT